MSQADSGYYQIQVRGCLDKSWESWFEGMTIIPGMAEEQPGSSATTLITGFIPDQAALHGILNRIGNLGLTILMVKRLE